MVEVVGVAGEQRDPVPSIPTRSITPMPRSSSASSASSWYRGRRSQLVGQERLDPVELLRRRRRGCVRVHARLRSIPWRAGSGRDHGRCRVRRPASRCRAGVTTRAAPAAPRWRPVPRARSRRRGQQRLEVVEPSGHLLLELAGEHGQQRCRIARGGGLLGERDHRTDVQAGRLQAGVRRSLAPTVDTHHRVEEVEVGDLAPPAPRALRARSKAARTSSSPSTGT
jgi:hypothetical protein